MKIKLLPKFILSLGVIGVILTISISLFSYRSSRSYLENLYAQRVMTNSNSIADMMSVSDVKKILAEGGDKTEEYSEMVTLFNKLKIRLPMEVTFCTLTLQILMILLTWRNILPYGTNISRIKVWIIRL